jgi:hypothetical protein
MQQLTTAPQHAVMNDESMKLESQAHYRLTSGRRPSGRGET